MSFFSKPAATYAVIGLGRFGTAVAKTLYESGKEIILIDKDPDKVRELRYMTEYAYVIDHMDKAALEEVGVSECEVAVVCIGSATDANILTTLYCVSLGVSRVIAKANSEDQGLILTKIGAEVVFPERDSGERLAKSLVNKNMIDYFALPGNMDVVQMKVPLEFSGHSLLELDLPNRFGISVVAIESGGTTSDVVDPNYVFKEGDSLVLIGSKGNLNKFEEEYAG